jgi:glutaredoxin 3
VDALERVPEAFRGSAVPMSMGGGSRQSQAPQLTRAETRTPKRRPYAGASAQPPARRARASAGVVVYSTSWCPWCRKTLAWLDERGIDYENRDIEKNPAWREELLDKSGGTSIPVVEIDGELIHGFQPGRMGELL